MRSFDEIFVEYESYECPVCWTQVLIVVYDGGQFHGRKQIAVKLGPGIIELN
jgi:hypothetical protein